MNLVWFVTSDSMSPEGYYVGAATEGKARAVGANEIGCDFIAVKVERIDGQQTELEGFLPVWQAECFLCHSTFRTVHSPLTVPPACDHCRELRDGAVKLDANNL